MIDSVITGAAKGTVQMEPGDSQETRESAGADHWTPEQLLAIHKALLESELAHGVLHDANNMLMVAETNLELLTEAGSRGATEFQELANAIQSLGVALGVLHRFTRSQGGAALLSNLVIDSQAMLQHILTKKIKLATGPLGSDGVEVAQGRWQHALLAMGLLARLSLGGNGVVTVSVACRHGATAEAATAELIVETEATHAPAVPPADPAVVQIQSDLTIRTLVDIAEEIGGHFVINRLSGGGMRWSLTAPCRLSQAPAEPVATRKEGKVVVADANEYTRSMILSALRGQGWSVAGKSTLTTSLEAWRDPGGAVLVIDGELLSESGKAELQELTESSRRVIVLRPAAHGAPRDWELSSLPILQKPFQMGELVTLVHIALQAEPNKDANP